jgi:glycosyltransferase involved in cell wall biosynthesis
MEKWNLIIYTPAYNVEKTITELLDRIVKTGKRLADTGVVLGALVIVNDGSGDKTKTMIVKAARKKQYSFVRLLDKPKNEGPTKALFDGMDESLAIAQERGYVPQMTIMVRMDSDLEHQPEDLPKLLEPITAGKTNAVVGYIPYDERSGQDAVEFNLAAGLEESRKFLGVDIPQFCPGFNAIRLDLFSRIHAELVARARKYEHEMKEDMLAVDFVELVIAKDLGWQPEIVKLLPIESKTIKKPTPEKLGYYQSCHEKIMKFLEKEYPTREKSQP